MDAAREREIRDLATRLIASKRHRKIGLVVGDLLAEIDLLREDDEPMTPIDFARARHVLVEAGRTIESGLARHGSHGWRDAARAISHEYAESKSPSADVSA